MRPDVGTILQVPPQVRVETRSEGDEEDSAEDNSQAYLVVGRKRRPIGLSVVLARLRSDGARKDRQCTLLSSSRYSRMRTLASVDGRVSGANGREALVMEGPKSGRELY
jgi:hypothetical protein